MAIIETHAIVLKCDKYRETSKIVTLFTQTHGKIRCIAKGVRKTNTRWGGCLQSMAYLNVFYYYKENRTLHLLSNAEYIETYNNLQSDNEKLTLVYQIAELVNRSTFENHEVHEIFHLLVETLKYLNIATKNYVNVLFKFEISLAGLLGFAIDNMYENLKKGNMSGLINQLKNGNFSDITEFNILISDSKKLEELLLLYYMEHVENAGIFKNKLNHRSDYR